MNFQQRLQSLWSLASKLRITSRVCGCCSRRFCRMSRKKMRCFPSETVHTGGFCYSGEHSNSWT
ncbi:interleukin-24 isoform X4 [Pongo abelii]|uniref:IL24 isoform 3 n=2 Tax=Pongo abelii TaxID=9601 RepID=A0A2J8V6U8_PONAB|nr:interleukin-24 isoform X4 [Pongo pygmaeus]PNJ53219.1 IL24 isoform 3 [Pongo abelii]